MNEMGLLGFREPFLQFLGHLWTKTRLLAEEERVVSHGCIGGGLERGKEMVIDIKEG